MKRKGTPEGLKLMAVSDSDTFPKTFPVIIYAIPWYLRLLSADTILAYFKSRLIEIGRLPKEKSVLLVPGQKYILEVINNKKLKK